MVGLLTIETQRARPWPDLSLDVLSQIRQVATRQGPELSDRVTAFLVAEPPRDQVAHLFGDGPVARDFAANDRDDPGHTVPPRMVVQCVFSRNLAFADMFDTHQRADARPGVVDLGKSSAW